MDPFSMAAASIGSTVIGGIVSGAGAAGQADSAASSYRYKAGIASLNQTIAKQNAAWATNSGEIKAANYGMKAGQAIAETKVHQGSSGLDVNTGSNADVRDTQTDVARYDQGLIRKDAEHIAYGYEVEAAKDKAEQGMDLAAAQGVEKAGRLGILSSIIGTASSVASKWSQGNTSGIFSSGSGGPVGTYDSNNYGAAPSWSS